MEGVLFGSVWGLISLLLTTDDVVNIRATVCRWNVKMEQFEKNWHDDPQGKRVYTNLEGLEGCVFLLQIHR